MKSCEVASGPKNILDWCASTAWPASAALPSRPPSIPGPNPGRGKGRAAEWPAALSTARHVPEASPAWAGSLLRRGLDHGGLVDSAGSPDPAPGSGPPDGPNNPIMGPASLTQINRRADSYLLWACPLRRLAPSPLGGVSLALGGVLLALP